MYKLKPVFKVPEALDVHIACPMYKLKNLHIKTVDFAEQGINDVQLSDEEINLLLKRQNEVISTLEQLELRLSKLDTKFPDIEESCVPAFKKLSVSSSQCRAVHEKYNRKSESKKLDNSSVSHLIKNDTVIFADPDDPPYSVLALPILWPEISWDISYHVHSTLTKDLKELEVIKLFKKISCKKNKNTVKVIVIWQKTKPSPRIVRSPTTVLLGEVSLLRLFNQYLATETLNVADQRNSDILDLINEISCSTTDRTSELNNLIHGSNAKLDIDNIALWSLLYKKNNNPPKTKIWIENLTKQ
ncbi:aminoacyl tRNA synthase complex-interacting multifunctional protein 2-like, partial [Sipha flava]